MVLNIYREKIDSFLNPMAKGFSKISPNTLSAISLICAIATLLIFLLIQDPIALLIALILVILNGFFDAIDGKVAKMTGKASPKGDLVDHVIDRYADFFIIAGIALSAFADVRIGLLALGSVMIASYMGTQSQALGLQRDYGGMLGRAERIVLIMIFIVLQYLMEIFNIGNVQIVSGLNIGLLDVMLIIFIIAANITSIQRFIRIWRGLGSG